MNRYELFKSIKSFLHDCDSDDNKNWTYDEQASSICAMVDAHVAAEIERVTEVMMDMVDKAFVTNDSLYIAQELTKLLRERAKV